MKIFRLTSVSLVAVAWAINAQALDLLGDYQKALTYDPAYRTAEAEFQANQASATQARVAYLPQASLSNQRLDNDTTDRRTMRVTQPVIDLARFAEWQQAEPRQGYAEATFLLKQQDLAQRILKGANAIILANENLKLNAAKIDALSLQAEASKRKLELGQGTVTDLRDVEVKTAQAKAQQLGYKTALSVAVKQYAAITGQTPDVAGFQLGMHDRSHTLQPTLQYVDAALQKSPGLQAIRYTQRVAELEVRKSSGALLPTVAATYSNSKAGELTSSYSGIVVNMPLNAGSYYARQSVNAAYIKAQEAARDAEQKTRLEVERLSEQISTGLETLAIQKDAIASAELSLEANQKSYEGGVRSTVDVLNATQTVFQVKSEYITTATAEAENLLALSLQTEVDPVQSLQTTLRYLIGK